MPVSSPIRFLAILALTAVLSGCGAVHPAGLLAARSLDPLGTDPSDIAIAVGVPDELRLADGDARLTLSFRGGTASSTVLLEDSAPLRLTVSGPDAPGGAEGETVYVARIAPADAPRIAAVQDAIRTARADGVEGQGSLTIAVTGGCHVGATPPPLVVSTWLRTDPDASFVPLTRRQDIANALGADAAAQLMTELRPCR